MTTPNLQVRRATVEDLPKLIPLWKEEGLPSEVLEQRFKEFQVVESRNGDILGTFALLVSGLEGCLHSEAFAYPEQADALRDILWERVQIQAKNFGLVRLWTQLAVPFWHTNGFQYASKEVLAKVPASFAGSARPWLFLQMREESAAPPVSLDKEFELFKQSEKEQTQEVFRQARLLKGVATIIALVVLLFIVVMSIRLFRAQHQTQPPRPASSQTTGPE